MRYHRVPQVIGGNIAGSGAMVRADENLFRNATPYPMEIHAVGFSMPNAHSSEATQSYSDVGLFVSDQDYEWIRGAYPAVTWLLDLAGNTTLPGEGADLFTFHGTVWRLRHPVIVPGEVTLQVTMRNLNDAANESLDVFMYGSLILPETKGDSSALMEQASRWDRAVGALPALPPDFAAPPYRLGPSPTPGWAPAEGDDVVAYAPRPFVSMSNLAALTTGVSTPFTASDFRNQTQYPLVVHAVGLLVGEESDSTPSQGLRDISLLVQSGGRSWNIAAPFAAQVPVLGSIMGIGQGSVYSGVKFDLGPGVLLAPGDQISAQARRERAVSIVSIASVIGEVFVPVHEGTAAAEALRQVCAAVPAW